MARFVPTTPRDAVIFGLTHNISRYNCQYVPGQVECTCNAQQQADRVLAELDPFMSSPAEGVSTALVNRANLVAKAIADGRLDGTDPAAVSAAIRASTPEEFEEVLRRD